MAVRKIRNSWWVDLRFNHTRYRKRSPENSRAGAVAYEITLRQKLARGENINGEASSTQQEPTFGQFAWRWFDDYVVANNKHSERQTKRDVLSASLVPFFGKMPISRISAHHIAQYKALTLKTGIANKTLKNRLTILRKCLVTAYEWLALEGTPPKVVWPKCPPPKTDYLSPEESDLLLSHAEGAIYEMALAALRTGMRQGELKGLQWSSIDWQSRSITVRHSRCDRAKQLVSPKSNRERHIPMDVDVHAILFRRKMATGYVFLDTDGRPFDSRRLVKRLKVTCDRAGLRHIGWHTLRHTFASHLAMKGAPMPAVQMLLGHSAINTTMRYAHMSPSTLRAAIELLNPKTAFTADFGQPVGNAWFERQRNETLRKNRSPESPLIS